MNNKIFPYIVAVSAFLVAFNAFFSVYGLSKLFAGAATSVIFMAGSLEFGKLVAHHSCSDIGNEHLDY